MKLPATFARGLPLQWRSWMHSPAMQPPARPPGPALCRGGALLLLCAHLAWANSSVFGISFTCLLVIGMGLPIGEIQFATCVTAICTGYQAAQWGVLNVAIPCLEQQLSDGLAALRCACPCSCVCPWQEAPAAWLELHQHLRKTPTLEHCWTPSEHGLWGPLAMCSPPAGAPNSLLGCSRWSPPAWLRHA